MSLISACDDLSRALEVLRRNSSSQQHAFHSLTSSILILAQKYRIEKNFEVSDALRGILTDAGLKVTQGTAGSPDLKGSSRPIGDSYTTIWNLNI